MRAAIASMAACGVAAAATQTSAAPEHYPCLPDRATGLHYDPITEDWTATNFLPSEVERLLARQQVVGSSLTNPLHV